MSVCLIYFHSLSFSLFHSLFVIYVSLDTLLNIPVTLSPSFCLMHCLWTVCPCLSYHVICVNLGSFYIQYVVGSSDPFYIVSYYIKWVTTSWTHSTYWQCGTQRQIRLGMMNEMYRCTYSNCLQTYIF